MGSDDTSNAGPGRPSKVAQLIDEYEMEGIGAELEALWTAEGDARSSLRDLADRFNRELVRAALEREGAQLLVGEYENLHRLLSEDDVSGADRTRARRRIERAGVDIDALESSFVSYQSIRTYLTSHRGAEYDPGPSDPVKNAEEHIERLRGRTAAVTGSKLEQLRSQDYLTLGDADTVVAVNVTCRDCGARYEVSELLSRGGCDCMGSKYPHSTM